MNCVSERAAADCYIASCGLDCRSAGGPPCPRVPRSLPPARERRGDVETVRTIVDELEALVDDPSEQYAEREEFEKLYYGLVASARQLISGARKLLEGDSASEFTSDLHSFI
ncbi:hypothetical protein HW555_001640 [Spodoptera exigua]|uniref:Uncharacterized protein n=1 Tax=Spodoptera exigua TaxID=7107 RepID=A0A835GQC2_SPOEX|nr:hypothetical protein HW555_001640 [Spodoptera exigua]